MTDKARQAPHRILIAIQDIALRQQLRALLEDAHFKVVAETGLGQEAIDIAHYTRVDVLIAETALPDLDGLQVAATVSSDLLCPVILLGSAGDIEQARQASQAGAFAYLVTPVTDANLLPTIVLSYGRWQQEQAAHVRLKQSQQKLQERELIECAKRLLMTGYHLNEQKAFRVIQQRSMRSGQTMGKVAEVILASTRIAQLNIRAGTKRTVYPTQPSEPGHKPSPQLAIKGL